MLGNITNNPLLTGTSVNQNENVNGVEKVASTTTNPYDKTAVFDDSLEVSDKAKELLQKEKDIEFFQSLVLDAPNSKQELDAIMKLLQEGDFIDNKELADAMHGNHDLMDYLLTDIGEAS